MARSGRGEPECGDLGERLAEPRDHLGQRIGRRRAEPGIAEVVDPQSVPVAVASKAPSRRAFGSNNGAREK